MANQAVPVTREAPTPAGSGFNWAKFFTYFVLILGAIIAIVPFLATISISLMNLTEATSQTFIPSTPQWGNYVEAWQEADFSEYFFNSLQIAIITVSGEVVFGVLAAYAFARMDFPGKDLMFGIMLATIMVPEMVQQLPNFLLVNEIGNFFGSEGLGLCGEIKNCWINNWPALTIPFMATPIAIFLLRQHFATIPMELWDAARMDGAGHLRFLIQVVVPLSKSALFVVILLDFIGAWNALAWPILVTSGDTWRPISYGLQSFIREEGNFAHLRMAGSMITTLPLLILYAFTQRSFVEGINTSGLKG